MYVWMNPERYRKLRRVVKRVRAGRRFPLKGEYSGFLTGRLYQRATQASLNGPEREIEESLFLQRVISLLLGYVITNQLQPHQLYQDSCPGGIEIREKVARMARAAYRAGATSKEAARVITAILRHEGPPAPRHEDLYTLLHPLSTP